MTFHRRLQLLRTEAERLSDAAFRAGDLDRAEALAEISRVLDRAQLDVREVECGAVARIAD